MRRIGLIAAREFLATVATRGFIVGVLVTVDARFSTCLVPVGNGEFLAVKAS